MSLLLRSRHGRARALAEEMSTAHSMALICAKIADVGYTVAKQRNNERARRCGEHNVTLRHPRAAYGGWEESLCSQLAGLWGCMIVTRVVECVEPARR